MRRSVIAAAAAAGAASALLPSAVQPAATTASLPSASDIIKAAVASQRPQPAAARREAAPPAPPSSAPSPSPAAAAAAAPLLRDGSAGFSRLSRLLRLSAICSGDADGGSVVGVSELLVTLSYLGRSLTAEESAALQRVVQEAQMTAVPMQAFARLVSDCVEREQAAGEQAAGDEAEQAVAAAARSQAGQRPEDESAASHERFLSFVLERLAVRLGECAAQAGSAARLGLEGAVLELAATRQRLRSAEQSNRLLQDRLDRLTAIAQQLEQEVSRLQADNSSAAQELSSDERAVLALQSSLSQQQAAAARLQSCLQRSEQSLAACRADQQSSLALLQFERLAKAQLQQELLLQREQIAALQAGRSSELRAALRRKKEAMAAIMDSHRYTQEMKATAARVPKLEQDMQALRLTIARQQDDIAEYQQLLQDWQGGEAQQGAAVANRARPAFSLCDDLDADGPSGSTAGTASRTHSRRPSALPLLASLLASAAPLPSLSAKELQAQAAELSDARLAVTACERSLSEARAGRDALLLSVSSLQQEKEEMQFQLTAVSADCERQQQRIRLQEASISRPGGGGRRPCASLQPQLEEARACLAERELRAAAERQRLDSLLEEERRLRAEAEAALRAQREAAAESSNAEVRQLRAELTAAEGRRCGLQAELAACQSQLSRFELLYPAALAELEAMRGQQADWQAEREELRRRVDELTAEVRRLQRLLDEHVCPTAPAAAAELPPLPAPAEAECRRVLLTAAQQEEVDCYSRLINGSSLRSEPLLSHLLPLTVGSSDLLSRVSDGLLLATLLNWAVSGLIDARALNAATAAGGQAPVMSWQQIVQNLNLVVSAAKAIGVTMRQTQPQAQQQQQQPQQAFTPLAVEELTDDEPVPRSAAASSARPSAASVLVSGRSLAMSRSSDAEAEALPAAPAAERRFAASPLFSQAVDVGSAQLQLMQCSQPELVIDFIHQIVRHRLLRDIATQANTRLLALASLPHVDAAATAAAQPGPALSPTLSLQALAALPPEQLLLRWLNFILRRRALRCRSRAAAEELWPLAAADFGSELQSGRALLACLDELRHHSGQQADEQLALDAAAGSSREDDIARLLALLRAMGVDHFHSAASLSGCHERLQLLLTACIFQRSDGLPEVDVSALSLGEQAAALSSSGSLSSAAELQEGCREERAFRMWLNSAGHRRLPGALAVHGLQGRPAAAAHRGLGGARLRGLEARGAAAHQQVQVRHQLQLRAAAVQAGAPGLAGRHRGRGHPRRPAQVRAGCRLAARALQRHQEDRLDPAVAVSSSGRQRQPADGTATSFAGPTPAWPPARIPRPRASAACSCRPGETRAARAPSFCSTCCTASTRASWTGARC